MSINISVFANNNVKFFNHAKFSSFLNPVGICSTKCHRPSLPKYIYLKLSEVNFLWFIPLPPALDAMPSSESIVNE